MQLYVFIKKDGRAYACLGPCKPETLAQHSLLYGGFWHCIRHTRMLFVERGQSNEMAQFATFGPG